MLERAASHRQYALYAVTNATLSLSLDGNAAFEATVGCVDGGVEHLSNSSMGYVPMEYVSAGVRPE